MIRKLVAISILAILLPGILFAQVIDKSVATVKLTKTEAITLKQFKKTVEALEKSATRPLTLEEKKQVLERLIDEKMVLQAALRDGITVTDAEINKGVQQAKLPSEMQLGIKISDDQFKKLIEQQASQTGLTWDKLLKEVENSVIMQKYVQQRLNPHLAELKTPAKAEVEDYYDEHRTEFISPEMLRIKQIVVITQGLPASLAEKYKAKIESIYEQISKKGASFDEFYEVYIEGQTEKIGGLDIDVWQREDSKKKLIYGKDFFNSIFKMKDGSLSTVIKSNIGYHIVQVSEKIPFQMLNLDDKIPPKNTVTVRDQILEALTQNKAMELSKTVQDELVAELKKTAVIKIYEENLNW